MRNRHSFCLVLTALLLLLLPLTSGVAFAGDEQVEDQLAAQQDLPEAYVSDTPAELGTDALALLAMMQTEEYTQVPEHGTFERGFTTAELLRDIGIVAVILALLILLSIQFLDISLNSYRWALLIALFILPFFASVGVTTTTLEETKTVTSCQSCHVMDPFVDDMRNPESNTLASRHYTNKWIPKHQCYECHTSYGVHGTLAGKRDGFRHWLLFVTNTYPEPITYAGSYPNANCTACHADTPAYEAVESHQALSREITADEVTCTACHGPPHPVPNERHAEVATYDDLDLAYERVR